MAAVGYREMAHNKAILPDCKFDGSDKVPIRQYLMEFELYTELNEWNDEKAAKYLAVHLTGDAKAFLHELIQSDAAITKSYTSLKERLLERYEGGLATLRYVREWQQRKRNGGEGLHQFVTDLRLKYERAFPAPTPEVEPPALEGLSEENKERLAALLKNENKKGRREEYGEKRELNLKIQFINGLPTNLQEILIVDDGLLKKPLDQIIKRVASIEAEKGGEEPLQPVAGAAEVHVDGVSRNKRRWGPRSNDICRRCGSKGHWARSCPSLWKKGGQAAAVNSAELQAGSTTCYYVLGQIGDTQVPCLMDPGSQVSLINSDVLDTSNLQIEPSAVRPLSINQQPIVIQGRTQCKVHMSSLETNWQFLVVKGITVAVVLGVDFIKANHKCRWGVADGSWWFDNTEIPLWHPPEQTAGEQQSVAVCHCKVDIQPRHQTIIQMRTLDRSSGTGMVFESKGVPQGVLLSKTLVNPKENGKFFVRAINYSTETITLFKNQKLGAVEQSETITNLPQMPTEFLGSSAVNIELADADGDRKQKLKDLVQEYNDVFSAEKQDIGQYQGVQHHIQLIPDAVPVRQPLRRLPIAYQEPVKQQLRQMLNNGIIEKSTSPWASPLVIVKKPSGDIRICVDYRKVNEQTVKDSHPLPNITATLDRMTGAKWFSSFDLTSGYYQIEVAPQDREATAFISPYGLFQYRRMPFGLCNAPSTFQRVIDDLTQVLNLEDLVTYLDDIICFHETFENHLAGIRRVLEMCRGANLKLSPN